jgi:DNA-binding winged helix-turn-helix (wHTH) protein
MSFRFCGCVLDVEARQVFRDGAEMHLSPKAFETLRTLVENRPRAMSKPELLSRGWPGVTVSSVSLARVINEIRVVLGDDRRGRIIRTVHSHGYAFVAEVTAADSHPPTVAGRRRTVGWLISATRALPLHEGQQVIGRDATLDVCVDSPKVSRRHARIEINAARATIEDLGSKNGTFVRQTRIQPATTLKSGDEIRIGRITFTFRLGESPPSTETDGDPLRK